MKKEKFDLKGWNDYIRDHKSSFFPQEYEPLGFDSNLCTLPVGWTMQMVTGLGQLENFRKVPKCSVAKELMTVRGDVISAAKEMFRKRYSAIDGVERQYITNQLTTDIIYRYKMKDGSSGKTFYLDKYIDGNFVTSQLDSIYEETKQIIWREMVEKINRFFHPDICREDCECPKKITRQEISFRYPWKTCVGKTEESSRPCETPCKSYGEGYDWCGVKVPWGTWGKKWDYCTKANWRSCMGKLPFSMGLAQQYSKADVAEIKHVHIK